MKAWDEVQAELEAYNPLFGPPMSQALRERMLSETDPERIHDGMSDGALWTAWIRS